MNDKSMLEVAIELMSASSEPKNIYKLIDEVMDKLGLGDDTNAKAQLYIDITTCADFVFLGGEDDLWDLKNRQPLEAWDKSFYENESEDFDDEEDEGDDISMEDYNYVEDESDEEYEESEEDEDESTYEIDESLGDEDEDEETSWDEEDDENSWDEDEEEKYNDMMDDYEDLYEDK